MGQQSKPTVKPIEIQNLRSDEFYKHAEKLRNEKFAKQLSLGQFIAHHEVEETIPVDRLTDSSKIVRQYHDTEKDVDLAVVKLVLEGRAFERKLKGEKDVLASTGFKSTSFPAKDTSQPFIYNKTSGLWENDSYSWDPITRQTVI